MRYDNVFVTLAAVFVLIFGALYARSARQQLHFNSAQLEAMNSRLEGLIGLVRDTGVKDRMYADTLRKIEERLNLAEIEKDDLSHRIETLSLQVARLQGDVGMPAAATTPSEAWPVDLGEISVKK